MNLEDDIKVLKKQFLCCLPLNKLEWPVIMGTIDYCNADFQKAVINDIIENDIVLRCPIKLSYMKAFVKSLIQKVESVSTEVDESVYSTYCNLLSRNDDSELTHYRHFLFDKGYLSIKENKNIISQGTTGLCTWKAAFILAEWCISNREELKEKKVLELGSGVGLTGLTVSKFCTPKEYLFSDCHPEVLKLLNENIKLNLTTGVNDYWKETYCPNSFQNIQFCSKHENIKFRVIDLDWENIGIWYKENGAVDIIIAADILYDRHIFGILIEGLKHLLTKNNYALIVVAVRNETTMQEFIECLNKERLFYEDIQEPKLHMFLISEETPVRLLRIKSYK